jgi:group I intron endonuclease
MEKIIGIYKITNPKNVVYIGQSIDVLKRFIYYKRLSCKRQFKLYNSLKKYGADNHVFEILQQCSQGELNELEIYYINLFQCFDSKHGLNLISGGGCNSVVSNESKTKNRLAHIGKKASAETKIKMGIASKGHKRNSGKKQSKEWIEKRTTKTRGLKRSMETRKKLSVVAQNRIFSPERIQKISDYQKARIRTPFTEDTKRKISIALAGKKRKPLSESHKEKIKMTSIGEKNHMFGKHLSDEHKNKIRLANRKNPVL